MPKAVRIHQTGGPKGLAFEAITVDKPGPGEARKRQTAIGLNFVDVYVRRCLYAVSLPSGLGTEASGVVEGVGPGVSDIRTGSRVAYAVGMPVRRSPRPR